MEILSPEDCWQLLDRHDVGRLAVAPAGIPDVFPINYVVVDRTVLFRTGEGTKLTSVVVNRNVALEIDGYDPATNTAWSVVLTGVADVVEDDDAAAALESLPLRPWNTAPKPHFVRVTPGTLAGRRFIAEGRHSA